MLESDIRFLQTVPDFFNICGERFTRRLLFFQDFLRLVGCGLGFHLRVWWETSALQVPIQFDETAFEGCQINRRLAVLVEGLGLLDL